MLYLPGVGNTPPYSKTVRKEGGKCPRETGTEAKKKGARREHGVTTAREELGTPSVHQEPDKAHSSWLACVNIKEASVSIAA